METLIDTLPLQAIMICLLGLGGVLIAAAALSWRTGGWSRGAAFRAAVQERGLDQAQEKCLRWALSLAKDPWKALRNEMVLDKYFRAVYRAVTRDARSGTRRDAEVQHRLALLFSTRRALDVPPPPRGEDASLGRLAGRPAILFYNKTSFPVRVLRPEADALVVTLDGEGKPAPHGRGAARLAFYSRSERGFYFACRLLGKEDAPAGAAFRLGELQTPRAIPRAIPGRPRTREISLNCVILPEAGAASGDEGDRGEGRVRRLSAAGCVVETAVPVKPASRLILRIEPEASPLEAACLVVRTNRSSSGATLMYARFLDMSLDVSNRVQALVFGYE